MSSDLRFMWESAGGEVPENWSFHTIESLLENEKSIAVGVMYPGGNVDDGVPLIKVSDIKNGYVQGKPDYCISNEVEHEYRRTRLAGAELLITLVGEPGDCAIVSNEMKGWNVARAIAVLRLAEPALRPWLRYVLLSRPAKHLIDARLNTTVQKTLNLKDIRRLGVPIPPVSVREDIVYVLSSLEKKINLNRRINQTLEAMAQAIFKSWFVDFDPVRAKIAALEEGEDPLRAAMCAISGKTDAELEGMSREDFEQLAATAALFPDAMEDSELGEIPRGWGVSKIGDVIERFSVGKRYSQKTVAETGAIPVLDQGRSGIIGYHDETPGVKASPEDPIIVFANHTCYMRLIMHDFSAIQNVLPFKGKGLDIYWLYYATLGKQEFIEYKGHWPDFVINEIVVPSKRLDQCFGAMVSSLVHAMFRNEKQSNTLSELRDALLPKLLSGELLIANKKEFEVVVE